MNRIARALDALGIRVPKNIHQKLAKVTALLLALSSIWVFTGVADAATLSSASVAVTDTQPNPATANYNFTASSFSSTSIKCIQEVYTLNSDGSGGAPGSMSTSGVTLDASTNFVTPGSWSLYTTGVANGTVVFHDTSGAVPGTTTAAKFNVDGITNPVAGIFWMTFTTYTADAVSGGCTGSPVDSGVVGFNITAGAQMTLTINPSLTFTIGGLASSSTCNGATSNIVTTATSIPFGNMTSAANSTGCQAVTAATNATGGYTVYLRDTGQMANTLLQTIHDFSGTNASPTTFSAAGTENYGYTTAGGGESQFTSNTWAGFNHTTGGNSSANNEPIATYSTPQASSTFNVGFEAGVSNVTKPGSYQTTVVYTCTPIF